MTTPPTAPPRREFLGSAVGQLLHRLESYVPTEAKKGNPGKLAALHRGAGRRLGEVNEAMLVFYGETSIDLFDDEADDLYTVSTLFALHSVNGDPVRDARSRAERGLGASLAAIRYRDGGTAEDEGVSRRFAALLSARPEGVVTHLRQLIALLHSRAKGAPADRRGHPINYSQLFFDLRDWDAPDRFVQRNWAAGFWHRAAASTDAIAPTNNDNNNTTTDQED